MAAFNKVNSFVGTLGNAGVNFGTDTFKLILLNATPSSSDSVYNGAAFQIQSNTNAAEIANGVGYTQGGATIGSTTYSQSGGLGSLNGNSVSWTATGSMGPFRYVAMYDSSAGANANNRPVVGWWDYGSSITLTNGNVFTVNTNAGLLTLQ